MSRRLGVDVGGTFTDFVSVDDSDAVSVFKVLTTPSDPSEAVLTGTRVMSESAVDPELRRIVHGTTLVANSLIERKGARTALVTTTGFADVLEIGREARYDIYDLELERPEPLIPRPLRLEIDERTRSDGSILTPLDIAGAERLALRLQELGVESVAVCFLNAYRNPRHEGEMRDILRRLAPGIDVTLSSDVAPEWREYERTSTAAANAYVKPLVRRYLQKLESGFAESGSPDRLSIVLSHGGVTSPDVATEYAVQLVESGPAGGVMAAAYFGSRLGLEELISFDMGGTTAKVSVIEHGTPLRVPEMEVARVARLKRGSGLPLKVPTVELIEIGTGGGSLARRDALGLLKVGPTSAGADPGPACYGRGGTSPTVTDADLLLGYLNPIYFLGGAMELDSSLSERALAALGDELGLSADACAQGTFDIVNRQMALAVRTHVLERGRDPRSFTLVAFGGAGPVHAYEVARHLGINRILYPPVAGVASALGFLVAPFAVDLVRTHPGRLDESEWDAIAQLFLEMEEQARDLLRRSGADLSSLKVDRSVDLRYAGQGYEVTVPIDSTTGPELSGKLRTEFLAAYDRRFGSHLETAPVEALHWRLSAETSTERGNDLSFHAPNSDHNPLKGSRQVFFPELGGRTACPVYDRYSLKPGAVLDGPCLIEERESTIVVGPMGRAQSDVYGNLLAVRGLVHE